MKRTPALEDLYDLEDEINPNPARYVPTAEELALVEEDRQRQKDHQDTIDSILAGLRPA